MSREFSPIRRHDLPYTKREKDGGGGEREREREREPGIRSYEL
jgi:hypothetical protein